MERTLFHVTFQHQSIDKVFLLASYSLVAEVIDNRYAEVHSIKFSLWWRLSIRDNKRPK